jgi:3-isopropylmalate dehydratase small subunit
MKPSEFIEPSCFLVVNYIVKDKFSDIKDKNNDKVEINISYKLIKELDKRFIDREELIKKIEDILENHLDRYTTSYKDGRICYEEEIRKEILDLLK